MNISRQLERWIKDTRQVILEDGADESYSILPDNSKVSIIEQSLQLQRSHIRD